MIVVVGEILIDIFKDYERIGGAPFNFAFHLQQMGLPVRLLTRVGDDTPGQRIIKLLEQHRFDRQDVQIDAHHPTGTVNVSVDAQGVPQFDIRTDVAYDYLDLTDMASMDWNRVPMIYFGTLVQRSAQGFDQVQKLLSQKGPLTKCFCDINLRPPHLNEHSIQASLERADILKLNNEELLTIQTACNGPTQQSALVAWLMQTYDLQWLALTKGAQGSTIFTTDQTVDAPLIPMGDIRDTVGAGDGYAAVLAMSYLKGLPLPATIELATGFAAHICSLPGAVPSDLQIYRELDLQMGGKIDGDG